ncbi:MAG: ATP-grasp domain-containing protein [Clostridia bacterium]|nr:ATP-grasp domain-containing protein [Clostridia bacterium]
MSIWLLYDDPDYAVNQTFARMMNERGLERGLAIEAVLLSEITLGMDQQGQPCCLRNGLSARPEAVLSRQRDSLISEHFERMGVPVYNNARVCEICNDKRKTYQFLQGLPMPQTVFLSANQTQPPVGTQFPVILKPACSHGGDRVTLVENIEQWKQTAASILPGPALQQNVVSKAGCDLRVYILNGKILAGVMRTAREGVVSNFKKGGSVELHELTEPERQLAESVIRRFDEVDAPLMMAGIDLLYEQDHPVIGEVEDVVGSRMLYQTSDIDIVSLYLDVIAKELAVRK